MANNQYDYMNTATSSLYGGGLGAGTGNQTTGVEKPPPPPLAYGGGGGFPNYTAGQTPSPYANYNANLFDPNQWKDTTQATQYQQYLDNTLPLAQFQQNQQQYGMDFAEAQRRYNEEMARQQGLDQYQQSTTNRQLTMAEQQAAAAQQQWNQQFQQQQGNDAFSQNLATAQQAWNQNIQQQQQDLQGRQADIEAQYRAGLIDVQTAQNEIARINNQNQYLLGQGQNANQLLNYQNQFTLGQGQLDVSRQKLIQDAQMAADNRATQEKIAAFSATGRAQAPAARFIANW